ncbi:hypothetical protein [Haloplanus pelagicus]|jgi:hypothetical protein|uniref:hypothetical protein n=1 Tax=Haloplanus pelagicus TaxID=2949995 RepID=UPI00203DA5AC|nr:hypothetical protein [Haloplanus sp. HW8-1]
MPSRRTVVSGLSVALATGLAGCGALASPDPTVVETEIDGGIDALFGETDVFVVVRNDGAAGDVEVTLELLDGEGTVLLDESKTESFEADERKRVTFSVDVPEGTEEASATARAA